MDSAALPLVDEVEELSVIRPGGADVFPVTEIGYLLGPLLGLHQGRISGMGTTLTKRIRNSVAQLFSLEQDEVTLALLHTVQVAARDGFPVHNGGTTN